MEEDRPAELTDTCPYCSGQAQTVVAAVLFPHNAQKAGSGLLYWHCAPCRAWARSAVNGRPVGRLADAMLRGLQETVSAMLTEMAEKSAEKNDTSISNARILGRAWLAKKVTIKGMIGTPLEGLWLSPWADVEECRAAIRAMERYVKRPI